MAAISVLSLAWLAHQCSSRSWRPALLNCLASLAIATTTENVRIIVLPSHSCGGTVQNLDLKLLHSSMQTSADHRSGQRKVSHMTDEKGETVKSEKQARVSGDRLFHACAAATGKAQLPDESTTTAVSWCQHSWDSNERRFLMSDKYAMLATDKRNVQTSIGTVPLR